MSLHEPETNTERFYQALLSPLSLVWLAIIKIRQYLYDNNILKSRRLPVPVISIGNLTTGGTGKTPMVIDLVSFFCRHGIKVGILSRGYKRQSRQAYVVVSDGKNILSSASEAGDEPYLMAQACPQAVVIVGASRITIGALAQNHYGCQILILDDGFQHRKLQRDLDIVLYDYNDNPDSLQLLPAGKLREPLSALARADIAVITKIPPVKTMAAAALIAIGPDPAITNQVEPAPTVPDPVQTKPAATNPVETNPAAKSRINKILKQIKVAAPSLPVIQSSFIANALYRYNGNSRQALPLSQINTTVFVLSGIANPTQFMVQVKSCGATIAGNSFFADHHWFSKNELEQVKGEFQKSKAQFILTTEKDAVRLPVEFCNTLPVLVLGISVQWQQPIPYVRLLEILDKKYGSTFTSVLPSTELNV